MSWGDLIQVTPKTRKSANIIRIPARILCLNEAGYSQEEGPKKGFVMGSRTRGVQKILEKCM